MRVNGTIMAFALANLAAVLVSGTWIADALADSERLQTAGRAAAVAVTDSQGAFAAAEQTFAQVESAIPRDQIAVGLALSGGWSEATEQTESTDAVKR
jgi:hypothetical protein